MIAENLILETFFRLEDRNYTGKMLLFEHEGMLQLTAIDRLTRLDTYRRGVRKYWHNPKVLILALQIYVPCGTTGENRV